MELQSLKLEKKREQKRVLMIFRNAMNTFRARFDANCQYSSNQKSSSNIMKSDYKNGIKMMSKANAFWTRYFHDLVSMLDPF